MSSSSRRIVTARRRANSFHEEEDENLPVSEEARVILDRLRSSHWEGKRINGVKECATKNAHIFNMIVNGPEREVHRRGQEAMHHLAN